MFYQFNNFTGRLAGSQHFQPYFPVGVKPAPTGEAPKVTFSDPHVTIAKESPAPRQGPGGVIVSRISEDLRQKQMYFQKADGVLVHLKGGPMDRFLFGLTIALCGIGLAGSFKLYYDLAVPKK